MKRFQFLVILVILVATIGCGNSTKITVQGMYRSPEIAKKLLEREAKSHLRGKLLNKQLNKQFVPEGLPLEIISPKTPLRDKIETSLKGTKVTQFRSSESDLRGFNKYELTLELKE